MNETRTYPDGTTATGPSPLPAQSPKQQDSETGPCDKCQGSGKLFDRRIGDVECDECSGYGWFNDGVASPMRMPGCGVLPDGGWECVCGQCPPAEPRK